MYYDKIMKTLSQYVVYEINKYVFSPNIELDDWIKPYENKLFKNGLHTYCAKHTNTYLIKNHLINKIENCVNCSQTSQTIIDAKPSNVKIYKKNNKLPSIPCHLWYIKKYIKYIIQDDINEYEIFLELLTSNINIKSYRKKIEVLLSEKNKKIYECSDIHIDENKIKNLGTNINFNTNKDGVQGLLVNKNKKVVELIKDNINNLSRDVVGALSFNRGIYKIDFNKSNKYWKDLEKLVYRLF